MILKSQVMTVSAVDADNLSLSIERYRALYKQKRCFLDLMCTDTLKYDLADLLLSSKLAKSFVYLFKNLRRKNHCFENVIFALSICYK